MVNFYIYYYNIYIVRGRAPSLLGHGPKPRATMHDPMPIEPVILTWTHLEAQPGPLPINCILDGNVIA